jgi:hypothetical protein
MALARNNVVVLRKRLHADGDLLMSSPLIAVDGFVLLWRYAGSAQRQALSLGACIDK